jgi:hypothetical protein
MGKEFSVLYFPPVRLALTMRESKMVVLSSNQRKGGRNGFDGIESLWKGVPGSELPLNDRKTRTANQQFAYAA